MVVRSQGEFQPRIAAIVSRAISSFGALIPALDSTLPESSAAVSHLARFKLWAGTLGAHRVAGSRSLEYRLRDASSIKNHIISLLQDLCDALDDGILAIKGNQPIAEGVSESGEQGSAVAGDSIDADLEDYFRDNSQEVGSEISSILDGVGHIVDCLLRLSITIRNPAPHDHFKSRSGTDVINPYEQWDIKHVCEKFPNADRGLAERLGKAMARRRQYFKYREEHAMKLSEGLNAGDDGERGEMGERATTVASSIPDRLKESQAVADFAAFDDIESTVSKTSYAPSTIGETQLRVPPLPKEYADGPFGCPYCCMIVSIDTRHEWKKHVFRDLRPYVCLFPSCTTPEHQYLRRSDWIEHMKRDHWRIWQCPFGCSDTFRSAREFEHHVRGAHPSREPSRNLDTLQRLSNQPDYLAQAKGPCPLCLNFRIMSDKQYGSHVGAHLEQLALFALPSTDSGGDESGDAESESSGQDGKKYDSESLGSVLGGGSQPVTAPAEEKPDRKVELLTAQLDELEELMWAEENTLQEAKEDLHRKVEEMQRLYEKREEPERTRIEAERKPDSVIGTRGTVAQFAAIEALKAQLAKYQEQEEQMPEVKRRMEALLARLEGISRETIETIEAAAIRRAVIDREKAEEGRKKQRYEEEIKPLEREARERLDAELKTVEERKKHQLGETQAEAPPGKDFRDSRDVPPGVDAERARLGSRDGPLSKGSTNPDPMFAPSPFRGGFGRGGIGLVFTDEQRKIYHPSTAGEEAQAVEEDAEKVLEEPIKGQEEKPSAPAKAARQKMPAEQEAETQAKAQIDLDITDDQGKRYDPIKVAEEVKRLKRIEEDAKKALKAELKVSEESIKLGADTKVEREKIEDVRKVGFMPNQMQVLGIPQQPPQIGMGIAGPGMVQNRPDQRQFPMQVPQQPRQPAVFQVEPLRGLGPQERTIVNDMAVKLMQRANDATKNQIRQVMQQRWTPVQLQECAAKCLSPVFVFYQNMALDYLRIEQETVLAEIKSKEEAKEAEEAERYRGARTPSPPLPNESRGRRRSGAHQNKSPSSSPERPSSAGDAEQAATGTLPDRPMRRINAILALFDAELRPLCEDFINNPPSAVGELTEHRRIIVEQVMQRVIIPLDGVDVWGDDAARARRKGVMLEVQAVLRRMDSLGLPIVSEGGGQE